MKTKFCFSFFYFEQFRDILDTIVLQIIAERLPFSSTSLNKKQLDVRREREDIYFMKIR